MIFYDRLYLVEFEICEKSVGTTELHYSTKKRYHALDILKGLFSSDIRQSMKRRTKLSDVSYSDECRTKISFSVCLKHGTAFSCCSEI